jgi:hypothetical protein
MLMTPEYITAISALGTFFVIAVSAAAGVRQLQHIRASNQLAGIMRYTEWWESPHIQDAIKYIRDDLPGRLRDPAYRSELLNPVVSRAGHPELVVCDWAEQAGSYVKYGLLDEAQFLDLGSAFVRTMWERLEPVVAMRRIAAGPAMFENFEYLAARAQQFTAKRPNGNYPRNCPRLLTQRRAQELVDAANSAIGVDTNQT